jgi:hypothetical protein
MGGYLSPGAVSKVAVILCAFLTYLVLVHHTPAQAVAISIATAGATIESCPFPEANACGILALPPPGTGHIVTLGAGSTSIPSPIQIGNAVAGGGAGTGPFFQPTVPAHGFATADAFSTASSPPASFAASFASAVLPMVLFNHTSDTQAYPLGVSSFSGTQVFFGQNEHAQAHASVELRLDGNLLLSDLNGVVTPYVPATNPFVGLFILTVPLEPGFHSLLLTAQADGFASAQLEPTPEPATLLLWGTGAAGLGLARWVKRRRAANP